jgi:hypothetical protein
MLATSQFASGLRKLAGILAHGCQRRFKARPHVVVGLLEPSGLRHPADSAAPAAPGPRHRVLVVGSGVLFRSYMGRARREHTEATHEKVHAACRRAMERSYAVLVLAIASGSCASQSYVVPCRPTDPHSGVPVLVSGRAEALLIGRNRTCQAVTDGAFLLRTPCMSFSRAPLGCHGVRNRHHTRRC